LVFISGFPPARRCLGAAVLQQVETGYVGTDPNNRQAGSVASEGGASGESRR
jgi:hypothetical protein